MPTQPEIATDPFPRDTQSPHLWEIKRPELRAPVFHGFKDFHALSEALNRPTQTALDRRPVEPRSDEPDDDMSALLLEPTPDPRVLDWACVEHLDDEQEPGYNLRLLVLPPGGHRVELWATAMVPAEEGQVRELLAELGEQQAVEWAGVLPEPSEVADLIGHASGTIAEQALKAAGLPADQLVDAYLPARNAALSSITTLLEHAAEQGWTAAWIIEAWEEYCNDVDPGLY